MGEINDYSTTAGSNNAASPNGWPEAMAPSGLNNSDRELAARIKRLYSDNNGTIDTGGTSTAYTCTLNAQHSAWFDGLTFWVKFDQTNGASPTINPTGSGALGAKSLVAADGSTAPAAGEIPAGAVVMLQYNDDDDAVRIMTPLWNLLDEDDLASNSAVKPATQQSINAALSVTMPIGGLVPSLDTDTDHDINITAGAAADSTGARMIVLSSEITKQIDASWSVGDDAGGLDGSESVAGTPDADTWYYIHLILRSDTGVVDALFSESATSPTLPTNYDFSRLIGAVLTDGSANIIGFSASEICGGGVRVTYDAAQADQSGTIGASASLITISAPVNARMFGVGHATKSSVASVQVRLSEESQTDVAPSGAEVLYAGTGVGTDQPIASAQFEYNVGANQRIRARASAASTTLHIKTEGFIMERR